MKRFCNRCGKKIGRKGRGLWHNFEPQGIKFRVFHCQCGGMSEKEIKPLKFSSIMGFINYQIFWTGLVFTRNEDWKKLRLRRIKKVYGHKDKSKIWDTAV